MSIDATLKHDMFDTPNSINSYWAGFIAADGSISRNPRGLYNRIEIKIQHKDIQHLEAFKHVCGSSNKICTNTEKNLTYIKITSPRMVETLATTYNIVPRKTNILKFPDQLYGRQDHESCIRSFIRGYIDGDGCFVSYKRYVTVKFLSTLNFALHARYYMAKYTGCKFSIYMKQPYKNSDPLYTENYLYSSELYITRRTDFLQWLYEGSTHYTRLDRKYQIALKWMNGDYNTRNLNYEEDTSISQQESQFIA